MTLVPASEGNTLERIREAVVVVTIAVLIGLTVYTLLGFAWTFKAAVESTQRLRHPFGTP